MISLTIFWPTFYCTLNTKIVARRRDDAAVEG